MQFGTITIKDSGSGATLLSTKIPLTPGPLVVVVKDTWPPSKPTSVETISASFVPPKTGSAVRLCECSNGRRRLWPLRDSDGRPLLPGRTVNLAVDVKAAGLQDGSGKALASNVLYTLGSKWIAVPAEQQTFSATSSSDADNATDVAAAALASAPFTPPAAPDVFTTFLLGSKAYGCEPQPSVVRAMCSAV